MALVPRLVQEDNEEEYRKMIDEKKNAQLKRILDKTDEQMKHFTDLVARHKLDEKV